MSSSGAVKWWKTVCLVLLSWVLLTFIYTHSSKYFGTQHPQNSHSDKSQSKSWLQGVIRGSGYLKDNNYNGAINNTHSIKSGKRSTAKSLWFLGKELCIPPWTGKDCQEKKEENQCTAPNDDSCYFDELYGVAQVPCERWHSANIQQTKAWKSAKEDTVDRNDGHLKSFGYYKSLPENLGDVIELGSGPYTQSQTILMNNTFSVSSITLLDPSTIKYMAKVQHCFYKNGVFKDLPTTILGLPAEEVPTSTQYDTLIMINVIEHTYDAFLLLYKTLQIIKPGGLFIWNEWWWPDWQIARSQKRRGVGVQIAHPIKIKKIIHDLILEQFDALFYADLNSAYELKRMDLEGTYFIGRKKRQSLPRTEFPYELCMKQTPGNTPVVFIASSKNYKVLARYLAVADGSYQTVHSVTLVLENLMDEAAVVSLVIDRKTVRTVISHHHFEHWQQEAAKYINVSRACVFTVIKDNLILLPVSEGVATCDGFYQHLKMWAFEE